MKKKTTKRSFKDSISKAFLSYAMAPLAILAVAGILAAVIMMTSYIVRSNRDYNDTLASLWDCVGEEYSSQLEEFCNDEQVIACSSLSYPKAEIAQRLYDFRTASTISCRFFWLDTQGNVLAANIGTLPGYLTAKYVSAVSIIRKIQENPEEISLSTEYIQSGGESVFCMGRGILENGVLCGMLIFEIGEEDFRGAFREISGIHYIVTNSYDHALWYSSDMFIAPFGKLQQSLAQSEALVSLMDMWLYTRGTEVLDGFLKVYTVTEIGLYISVLAAVIITFVLLFLLLLLFIYITSGILAARQTRSVSRIVEAMDDVSYEKLGVPLELRTGDELEDIAVSYNKMKEDMKHLIARNEEIARENVISEIKQLELQLEPHFLYNTLELIRFMTKINPDNVGKVISALGLLLRQSIDMSGSMLTMGEELEFCRNYLLIQKYRFGDKLRYHMNVEEQTRECRIPKRILQPLIENALKHGTDEMGRCHIEVSVGVDGDIMFIRVEDEGGGLSEERKEELARMFGQQKNDSGHNGLYNVHRRIVLTYGDAYGVSMEDREKGAAFCIHIPFEKGERDV